jgi:helicase
MPSGGAVPPGGRRGSILPALAWLKITDPDQRLPLVQPGTDLRVLLPEDDRFTVLADKLDGIGAQVRRVRYLLEDEAITAAAGTRHRPYLAASSVCRLHKPHRATLSEVAGGAAVAARNAFNALWEGQLDCGPSDRGPVPTDALVPRELSRFLPFATLNPAQAETLPHVFADDLERLHQACREAGVGLHYQGWEHRHEAERAFRQRETDVLVATSTVAAGVNLPARAVIVQDTQVGLAALDVATVQQMFGRAGRIGVGEDEGWAFLIVDSRERADWQSRLVAGHTVDSRIQESLGEQLLSEAVQRRVTSQQQAERWWVQTLAYHQGQRSLRPLRRAIQFLISAGMLTVTPAAPGDRGLAPTELGRLTARLMVSPVLCDGLVHALARAPVPAGPEQAEDLIVTTLAVLLPKLAQASAGDDAKAAVARLLAACGHVGSGPSRPRAAVSASGSQRGDLARAALLAVANSPEAFRPGVRQIGNVPYAAMYPVLEQAPRYLHWLACQGLFGTLHPWCAIVAADLERRITWRMLQPARGAGRLLWACEQMATTAHAAQLVPELWTAARAAGYASPDWPAVGRPRQCRLDSAGYLALLRERATATTIEDDGEQVYGTGPAGSVLAVWAGRAFVTTPIRRGQVATAVRPPATGSPGLPGAAIFTWRGDYRATGWLAAYDQIPGDRPASLDSVSQHQDPRQSQAKRLPFSYWVPLVTRSSCDALMAMPLS